MSVVSHRVDWHLLSSKRLLIKYESTLRYIPENLIFPHLFRRKLIGSNRRLGSSKTSCTHVREPEQKKSTAAHISGSLGSCDNIAVYVFVFCAITARLRSPAHLLRWKDTHVPLYCILRLFRAYVLGLTFHVNRSHWPRGIMSMSAVSCLLELWVRIPPAAWKSVCCECCVIR